MWWLIALLVACGMGLLMMGRHPRLAARGAKSVGHPRPYAPPSPALGGPAPGEEITLSSARLLEPVTRLGATTAGEPGTGFAPLLDEVLLELHPGTVPISALPPHRPAEARSRTEVIVQAGAEADEAETAAAFAVSAWGDSDRGKRAKENEDNLLMLAERATFAVADGMGGYAGGRVASTLAVEAVRNALERGVPPCEPGQQGLAHPRGRELACALIEANRVVFEAARAEPALANMGTTLVAARFVPERGRLYVGHVGDSRCYRLRRGQLTQLTTDHNMKEWGIAGPKALHLTRAIGLERDVVVDLIVDKPLPGDLYVLCSDGLFKMISEQAIRDTLLTEEDLEAALYCLIEQANDAGGRDNTTIILIRVSAPKAPVRGERRS